MSASALAPAEVPALACPAQTLPPKHGSLRRRPPRVLPTGSHAHLLSREVFPGRAPIPAARVRRERWRSALRVRGEDVLSSDGRAREQRQNRRSRPQHRRGHEGARFLPRRPGEGKGEGALRRSPPRGRGPALAAVSCSQFVPCPVQKGGPARLLNPPDSPGAVHGGRNRVFHLKRLFLPSGRAGNVQFHHVGPGEAGKPAGDAPSLEEVTPYAVAQKKDQGGTGRHGITPFPSPGRLPARSPGPPECQRSGHTAPGSRPPSWNSRSPGSEAARGIPPPKGAWGAGRRR